jgi:hypothetical protein
MYNPPNPTSQASPLVVERTRRVCVDGWEPGTINTIEKEDTQ